MDIEKTLREWGLTEKESKVYLAVLNLGQSKVNEIAKQSTILRESVYFILNSLTSKGLVSSVIKSGVKYFEAAEPSKLLEILKEREEKINKILPVLNSMKANNLENPLVELYEGKEGLKTILDTIIQEKKELCAYANYEIFEYLEFEFPKFILRRVKNKIFARIIQERHESLVEILDLKENLLDMKFSKERFDSNVFIYGDNVAFITVADNRPFGVVIKNSVIANTQRQVFELMWEGFKD